LEHFVSDSESLGMSRDKTRSLSADMQKRHHQLRKFS
jgi:hypothetical protein